MRPLANFDPAEFLADYWQQQPLLIRQALPGFSSLLSPEELAGLACEEGVHSRLVIEQGAETPWQLRYGPFHEEDFTALPPSHYSLLVSECEKWLPELQQLLELFDFIPRWRIDDLMISYAPDQGSVGPHIDEYDVFLIQANGRRRWSIGGQKMDDNPAVIPELDLAILQNFEAEREWILEPGDMLYLPPRIAHHGVAVGAGCMTYSVGFRAPAVSDIMDSLLLEAGEHGLTDTRYSDTALNLERDPAEITVEDILHFRSMAYQLLDQSAELWPDIVGKLVSDTSLAQDIAGVDCKTLDQAVAYAWQKHPDSKLFYHHSSNQLRLFVNGQSLALPDSIANIEFCQKLCHHDLFDTADVIEHASPQAQAVFLQLIQSHALIPAEDDIDES